jgi:hypothetical protein
MPTFMYNGEVECVFIIDASTKKEAMQKLLKGDGDIRLENIFYGSVENIVCEEDFTMTDYYGSAKPYKEHVLDREMKNRGKKHKHITGENDETV